ncbi:LysR family transcriptional regulator [Ideonella sp.]|uniref:LysR family transcriptional regulator n=1 Tax=Ideonella sp. TaxID=1929293 RepID=UPI002B486437|nr:LysR family transcriptional regulator [Ideonella sp.]HJV67728.1 LysR family transcriptional regulator [Ideonella sp.]
MNASTQYRLSAPDLEVVLAMARTGTLAAAGERLGVDASTVFRSLQRIERGLGQALFARSRSGYRAGELAQALAEQAERIETALESARSAAQAQPEQVSGTVRITTTDTILHGLVAPALKTLHAEHPLLGFELHAANELASLTRRDADIAVRATRRPPPHLVGRPLGPIRVALYAGRKGPVKRHADVEAGRAVWAGPDDALPDHPSVVWRKRHFPKVQPAYRVNSILTVMELVAQGLAVGVLPIFLAEGRRELLPLTEEIAECQTELWLLAHPESRHLRRVSTVYAHLAQALALA